MIARAIGKPRTKAPAIAIVNSVSKCGSARNLLTDIFSFHNRSKNRRQDDTATAFSAHPQPVQVARTWLTG